MRNRKSVLTLQNMLEPVSVCFSTFDTVSHSGPLKHPRRQYNSQVFDLFDHRKMNHSTLGRFCNEDGLVVYSACPLLNPLSSLLASPGFTVIPNSSSISKVIPMQYRNHSRSDSA